MMRRGTFSSSLLFAAIAGLATLAYLSTGASPGAGVILLAVGYLVAIAPTTSRALRIGVLAGVLGLGVWLLFAGMDARIVGAAFLAGLLRSGFLYRSMPLRGLVIETFLLTTGLALAAVLNGYGPLSTALAVWGFFLVQSLYFLVAGVELRVTSPEDLDPFVKAREEAMRLMDEPGL